MAEEKKVEYNREQGGGGKKFVVIALIMAIVIAVAGYWFFKGDKNTPVVDATKFQAVFLTNGQTYFGKVVNPSSEYVSVTDVYYLVQKQPLQSQNKDDQNQDQAKPEYTLVKLGKELHGPTSMSISKEQILFIENLADDSKVVSTIKNQK